MVRLPPTVEVGPQGAARGALRVPGSKSITNRALLVAALAEGETRLRSALVAEDSEVMLRALGALGIGVRSCDGDLTIRGAAGPAPASSADLDLRLSGTSLRFLVAAVALGQGRFRLDGNERMRERPIQESLDAINALGGSAVSGRANGCPPVTVTAAGLEGGTVRVRGDRSSQFLSGLLMAAPYARSAVTMEVEGELLSKPFIDMTLDIMSDFGVEVERDGYRSFRVSPALYRARDYQVEGDAMAAGYFWAAAAVSGGQVRIDNLGSGTRQGDARLAEVLSEMGCDVVWGRDHVVVKGPHGGNLRGGASFDLNDMPDQAQTLAVVALFADGPVRIHNVGNMRIKETDRLAAMSTELTRLGARVIEGDEELTVHPFTGVPSAPVVFETYGDHRMAMALAVAGARLPNIVIKDPGCVAKTYPRFFDDFLAFLGGRLS